MSNISRRLRLLIDLLIRERGRRKIAVVVHMCALCCSVSCLDLRASGALKAGGVAVGSTANHVQLVSGTPQADAVLSALNDPTVTVALLIEDVGVTQFAAESWIDWRESQPFTSIDDVVHAAGVTPSDVTLLARWAWGNGYLPIEAELLGTWDGVDFTADTAALTLRLVNEAEARVLDEDVGLDSRAVDSILDARPVASMTELSSLFWIGPDTMALLKESAIAMYATSPPSALTD